MIESGAVCLAVKVKSATIYFEASKVALPAGFVETGAADVLFGGPMPGRSREAAAYASFRTWRCRSSTRARGEGEQTAMVLPRRWWGRPRDTRYD